jgi:hypothetical protein
VIGGSGREHDIPLGWLSGRATSDPTPLLDLITDPTERMFASLLMPHASPRSHSGAGWHAWAMGLLQAWTHGTDPAMTIELLKHPKSTWRHMLVPSPCRVRPDLRDRRHGHRGLKEQHRLLVGLSHAWYTCRNLSVPSWIHDAMRTPAEYDMTAVVAWHAQIPWTKQQGIIPCAWLDIMSGMTQMERSRLFGVCQQPYTDSPPLDTAEKISIFVGTSPSRRWYAQSMAMQLLYQPSSDAILRGSLILNALDKPNPPWKNAS